ncbi:MAG TPA: trigger factor [Verrucomicrobiae bacterium]|nr:trigger factor [Verrucomicrobiae bacterium]
MNVTIEDVSACRKRLRIEVPPNEVNAEIERMTDEFRKFVRVPGFRPGKVPRDVVAKRFHQDIDDEVRRSLVPKAYRDAVKSRKLRVVSSPMVEELKFERGLSMSFSAIVELAPEIRLPMYKGISVSNAAKPVTDEDVEKAVNFLREQEATFKDAGDRALGEGDFAVVKFTAVCEGKPLQEVAPSAKSFAERENLWIQIQEGSFLPGFATQLIGLKVGDRKDLQIDFPAEFQVPELAGKKATFFVEVTGLKDRVLPDADEAFAKRAKRSSMEEMKRDIRERFEAERKADAEVANKNQVVEFLLSKCQFDVPESILEYQTRNVIRRVVEENAARGMAPEELQGKKDEIYRFALKNAHDRVRADFILLKVAEEEKLEVGEAELNERLAALARRYQMTPKKLMQELEKHDGLSQLEQEMLIGKTLDFLLKEAKLEQA